MLHTCMRFFITEPSQNKPLCSVTGQTINTDIIPIFLHFTLNIVMRKIALVWIYWATYVFQVHLPYIKHWFIIHQCMRLFKEPHSSYNTTYQRLNIPLMQMATKLEQSILCYKHYVKGIQLSCFFFCLFIYILGISALEIINLSNAHIID